MAADAKATDATAPGRAAPGTRVLPLQGGRNFRDMGGYRTGDGRQVRWGMLYRSGVMAGLTEVDHSYLNGLGIRSVCDLRHDGERRSEPTLWRGSHEYWAGDHGDLGDLGALMADRSGRTREKMHAAMVEVYRALPTAHSIAYARIFRELAAGRAPLVFNCSAGKDRTGVAAALILTALGVPRETVVEDYLLTNEIVDLLAILSTGSLARLPREIAEPICHADQAYIDAMFDLLDQRHGSVEAYLDEVLGIGPAELGSMRAHLLV